MSSWLIKKGAYNLYRVAEEKVDLIVANFAKQIYKLVGVRVHVAVAFKTSTGRLHVVM